jgi:glycosyltransferase involved in cell wall biosynthesis
LISKYYHLDNQLEINYHYKAREGGNAARNWGTKYAKGEFIQYFDSDDIMTPDFIAKRLNILLTNNSLDFCGCNWCYFRKDPSECINPSNINLYQHNLINHLKYNLLTTQAFLLHKSVIDRIGLWDNKIKRLQDIDFFSRLFYMGVTGRWIDDVLVKIRKHDHNISADNSPEIFMSATYVYEKIERECKQLELIDNDRTKLIGTRILENSQHCYTLGYYALSWKFFWKAWLLQKGWNKYPDAFYFIRKNIIRILKSILGIKRKS